MSENKRLRQAMMEAQEEMVNLCDLSSSASNSEALQAYKLLLKSWRNVWEQLPKLGQVSQNEANEAMVGIENICGKMGVDIKNLK
ncbi:MAG: hypothetical protein HY912_02265 [Desulfomonile tiedjei]|uniref:Uncharacterized protein n=1 Tax=Desulfomonile tiedjei TaxID=2358 RepID=A0A9D6Z211_9BACT|nr:hypothetical protein [Desulfomonile tiedjei]